MQYFVGDAGAQLLGQLKAVGCKHGGKARGKQLKRRLMRTAIKLKLRIDQGALDPRQLHPLTKPAHVFLLNLYRSLETVLLPGNGGGTSGDISNYVRDIQSVALPVFSFMSAKNYAKLDETLGFFADGEFWVFFLISPSCEGEREKVHRILGDWLFQQGEADLHAR